MSEDEKKKSKTIIILTASLILLAVLAAIAGYLILNRDGGPQPNSALNETVKKENEAVKSDTERINKIKLAQKFIARGRHKEALELLNELLIADPDDEEANKLWEEALRAETEAAEDQARLEQLAAEREKSILNADEAAQSSSKNKLSSAEAEKAYAEIDELIKAKDYKAAREKAVETLAKEPGLSKIRSQLAQIEEKLAAEREEELREQGRNVAAQKIIPPSGSKTTDEVLRSSEELSDEALDNDPNDPSSNISKAQALLAKDPNSPSNKRKAISYLEKALAADPENLAALNLLGKLEQDLGNSQKAIDYLKKSLLIKPDGLEQAAIYAQLAVLLYLEARFVEANKNFELALKLDPTIERINFSLGLTALQLADKKQALKYFTAELRTNPKHAATNWEMAQLIKDEELNKAKGHILQAIETNPNNSDYYRGLGSLYFVEENYALAIDSYKQALAQDSSKLGIDNYNIAASLSKQKKYRESLNYISKAISNGKTDIDSYLVLAEAQENTNSAELAIKTYRRAIGLDPQDSRTLESLGALYIKQKDYKNAEIELEKAFKLSPESKEILNNLALSHLQLRHIEKSIETYKKALEYDRRNTSIIYNLALSYIKKGEDETAIKEFEKLLAIDVQNWDSYYELAKLQILTDKKAAAARTIASLEKLNPSYPKLAELKQLSS